MNNDNKYKDDRWDKSYNLTDTEQDALLDDLESALRKSFSGIHDDTQLYKSTIDFHSSYKTKTVCFLIGCVIGIAIWEVFQWLA